jgi:hypothetical protein
MNGLVRKNQAILIDLVSANSHGHGSNSFSALIILYFIKNYFKQPIIMKWLRKFIEIMSGKRRKLSSVR